MAYPCSVSPCTGSRNLTVCAPGEEMEASLHLPAMEVRILGFSGIFLFLHSSDGKTMPASLLGATSCCPHTCSQAKELQMSS